MNKKLFVCGVALAAILASGQAVKAEEVPTTSELPEVEVVEVNHTMDIESQLVIDTLTSGEESVSPERDTDEGSQRVVDEQGEVSLESTNEAEIVGISAETANIEESVDRMEDRNEEKGYAGFKSRGESTHYHEVKSGDSLWAIANLYKITLDELLKYNNFPSLDAMIHPGDKLIVKPGAPAIISSTNQEGTPTIEDMATPAVSYTIQSGDSLWKISQKYGLTLDELVKLNGFSSYKVMIHPGQQIIVKKGTGNTVTVTPTKPQATAPISLDAKRQKVIDVAKKYLGVPYIYGGKTPRGFDCSGFVGYVFKEALGIDITTWTVTQETKGTEVAIKNAQPGDLFFYGPRGGTEHVSIYLGGKQYIHAPYPGQVVKIADMTYYVPSFARRIIQ